MAYNSRNIIRMNIPNDKILCNFQNKKKIDLGNGPVDFQGQFLFIWPYKWDQNIDWALVNDLYETVLTWMSDRIPPAQFDSKKMKTLVHDCVLSGVLLSPVDWVEKAPKDAGSYNKLLTFIKVHILLIVLDDIDDNELETSHHSSLVRALGCIAAKILSFEFPSVAEVSEDENFLTAVKIHGDFDAYLKLLFDVSQELQFNFGVTRESGKYFARQFRYEFELQTWCEGKDSSHLLNLSLQHQLRFFTGGVGTEQELLFLLDDIQIPRALRDNVYWTRCLEVTGFLLCRTNDIIGLERELIEQRELGKRVDNIVFIYMEVEGCTFEKALVRALREHDDALEEFHSLVKFLQNNPQVLFDLDEESKDIFFASVKLMIVLLLQSVFAVWSQEVVHLDLFLKIMAKSLRSKWVRRMKAAKREKYGKREHDRLIKMLEEAGDYQVVPKVKEEPMEAPELEDGTSGNVDNPIEVPTPEKPVTKRRLVRKRFPRRSRKDMEQESSEDESPKDESVMDVSIPEKEKPVRVYSGKTKKDQFGNYPPWMSVRKINKQKKRNKRLHSQKRKIIKAKKIK
ncbi:unnamed protein product [Allacma fusca]|uniref:Uncharacterized protein n=1 Tax=Allacma fusca TaxID=39272 RepID=A0A8J2JUA2_9HEXA|nr:unnamed protein product [Allacma fusca]